MNKRIVGAILSIALPGAGQIYSHQWMKGSLFLIAAMFFSGMVRRVSQGGTASLGPVFGNSVLIHLILLGLALWSAVDVFRAPAKGKK